MKRILVALLLLSMVSLLFAGGEGENGDYEVGGFLRSETVFVTGGMWGVPSSFNPITWSVPAGLRGLVYESLFFYDPLTNEMQPWVAKEYSWEDDVLTIVIHDDVKWADGSALTSADIEFTFTYPSWSNPYVGILESEIVDDTTVKLTFENPAYHSIQLQLYTWPINKKAYWEQIPADDATDFEVPWEENLGSGPYTIEAIDLDRVIYLRNDEWWGIEALDITFPAKRVVYLRSMANNVAMALISQGTELDMANNFIPGTPIATASNSDLHTWYDDAPYMLPDNAVYLMPNCTMEPFDDAEFRKALAYAINVNDITEIAFENMATPVPNALGLLDVPAWAPYNNVDIAEKYGFEFDSAQAEAMLDAAGYVDQDGDGWRDLKDGSELSFDLSIPYGWTDWMGAGRIIVDNFNTIGINADISFPDEARWEDEMVKGNFEMILQNWGSYVSHSPYTIYMWLFSTYTPIDEDEWTGNFGRYQNEELMALVEEFSAIPVEDVEAGNKIVRKIQEIQMNEMPYIPLWVNGMWFMANDSVWTNWPGENSTNQNYPSLFVDKLQIGGLKMLSEIQLAE